MKSVNKASVDADICPNCKEPVTVPKSTRSFICRSCDAVIKVVLSDDGVSLKVVGKSVEEDATYQAIESDVAALKSELDELHARYLVEMARDYGSSGTWIRNVGVLAMLAGAVSLVVSRTAGLVIVLVGVAMWVAGVAMNSSRKAAKHAVTSKISDEMHRIGAQRDLLQRKAARLKTLV